MEALEAEAVSPDLEPTRDAIFQEIGAVQFPELMMEVDSHTRFSSALLGHENRRHGKNCWRSMQPC